MEWLYCRPLRQNDQQQLPIIIGSNIHAISQQEQHLHLPFFTSASFDPLIQAFPHPSAAFPKNSLQKIKQAVRQGFSLGPENNIIIILLSMRAQFKEIPQDLCLRPQISLLCNKIQPLFVQHRFATKRYKKVGKEVREKLLRYIQKGVSIINVAKKFAINYSTAKSIVQNHKKKKPSSEEYHSDVKISSTDECQSAYSQRCEGI